MQRFLLDEVIRMKAAHVRLHLLLAMVHGIETAGALLDPLPFKAKGQGRKRFALALNRLFPGHYSSVNTQRDLYNRLRSHLAHCMLPASSIVVGNFPQLHLTTTDDKLHIDLNTLYSDYVTAMERLSALLETDPVKNKRIAFDNLQHLYIPDP